MENFRDFNQRIEMGLTAESVEIEIKNIIDSSLGVLKNDLWNNKVKIHELEYRKELLEIINKNLDQSLLDQKHIEIQSVISLIDHEIEKLNIN